MSVNDRTLVISHDFTGHPEGSLLTDRPGWLSLDNVKSLYCYSNTAVGPEYLSTGVAHAAFVEGNYPLDQYGRINVYDSDAGSHLSAWGLALGFRGEGYSDSEFASYFMLVNGTDNNVTVWKNNPAGAGIEILLTISRTIQQSDIYGVEVESDGSGGCDITVYNDADTVIGTVNDPSELLGTTMYLYAGYDSATYPSIVGAEFGYLDREGNRAISNINIDYQVKSLGPMRVNGSGLAGVTGGNISYTDNRPYEITLGETVDSYVDIEPFDILDTGLQYATLKLTLYHPEGDLTENFDMLSADGWQHVTLSGATGNYIDKDLGAVDGDQIEIPTGVQFSLVTLLDNGDVHYDGALNQGQQHERRFFDFTTFTWTTDTVTINQTGAGSAVPVWRSTPAPPSATVGVPYLYNIGYLIDGDRPMVLSQAQGSTSLPYGLAYNNSAYPETIEGTIPSGSGTIVVSGIVTKAENGA